jgi:hypothetical protein
VTGGDDGARGDRGPPSVDRLPFVVDEELDGDDGDDDDNDDSDDARLAARIATKSWAAARRRRRARRRGVTRA